MTKIVLNITTESPLLLSSGPPIHNLVETLDIISGNTVRGLMAQQYINTVGKPEDKQFIDLFLSGNVKFGFARKNGSQVIPLSARSCKYHGGFKRDNGHGVVDLVLAGESEIRCSHENDNTSDKNCGYPVDYFAGFYDPVESGKIDIRKRLITRSAIDSVRGSAASQKLYSQRVIEEGQIFYAVIETPENLAGIIEKMICKPFAACIGKGRSRGQGWVTVSHEKDQNIELPILESAKERFCHFKDRNGAPLLAVTLLSDAIFHDDFLRDCTAPNVFHLESLKINPDEWSSAHISGFAETRKVFGFDGRPLCLPRSPRLAVCAGSVFLFKAIDNAAKITVPEGTGIGWIGDNNSEGFGLAVLWHPFHIQYQPDKEKNTCVTD